jgi:hypothetical protein
VHEQQQHLQRPIENDERRRRLLLKLRLNGSDKKLS